ncbi:4'-phosphopantetheinyl transferase superfamily protein [Kitasatospora sp. NA04385]|uniref:4'-phosphopantetheinyl transferase family protein n=1 Tax=Kitasatospora sp. NA04385 TaxID=2742135 RepID=UPI001591B3D0|nr:4'-phosphopantetheinyl transferase superfamily protein [Kitasatospora sp. NA04385]QKW21652.1 4'-phosphopantetheinyl transferase superfamily protein [Kitasatospora sp. NA04385]
MDTLTTGAPPAPRVEAPMLMAGPDAPWLRVRRAMAWSGHAVVHAYTDQWQDAVLAEPDLRVLLGARDWQRLTTLERTRTRERFAASRLLVRYAAGAALHVPPDAVELGYKPGGRPYLRGCDQIGVSISHTRDLIVVGLNRRGRIGVDTEIADRTVRYRDMRRLLCTPAERRWLGALDEPEQERELLRLWTRKEAYTKALGQGMRLGFTEFGFDPGGAALLTPQGRSAAHGEWTFGTHELERGYLVSIACHDAGHEAVPDTAVSTMLDEGFLGEVVRSLGSGGRP